MPIVFKQAHAIIDNRTTIVCLTIHGVTVGVDEDFETLSGDYLQPPFHIHCRTLVGPFMRGFVQDARKAANAELQSRPFHQRRRGPDGELGQAPPPPSSQNPPSGFSEEFAREYPQYPSTFPVKHAYRPENMARELTDPNIPFYEFRSISADHALIDETIRAWTMGMEGMDRIRNGDLVDGGRYLQEVLRSAPRSNRYLYRGMYPEDWSLFEDLQPGDAIVARTASSFTSSENYSTEFLVEDEDSDDEDALEGVQLVLNDGRAVEVGKRAGNGHEAEWLVGADFIVERMEWRGPRWLIIHGRTD